LFNKRKIHIELSSKCTLKCPRCPRTELDLSELNKEISLNQFKTAFSTETLADVEKIILCGDIGDPIYNRDFLEICEYIKSVSDVRLLIITNGSYKDTEWWQRLGKCLSATDQVTFSVDGWNQESNNLYRVNSDFDSIITGAKALRASSSCLMCWSAIYFKFNEQQMPFIKSLAVDLDFDMFQTVKSSKFDGRYSVNGVDVLKPQNIASTSQYERHTETLSRSLPVMVDSREKNHSWAKCVNWEKEMFISVEGLVSPCPWFNNGYQKNTFVERYQERLNIKTRTLNEILNDDVWNELVKSFDNNPLEICKIKCKSCL
jgi:MoaA/NifB/PqqE/SkfB family radical SAM enzyme